MSNCASLPRRDGPEDEGLVHILLRYSPPPGTPLDHRLLEERLSVPANTAWATFLRLALHATFRCTTPPILDERTMSQCQHNPISNVLMSRDPAGKSAVVYTKVHKELNGESAHSFH